MLDSKLKATSLCKLFHYIMKVLCKLSTHMKGVGEPLYSNSSRMYNAYNFKKKMSSCTLYIQWRAYKLCTYVYVCLLKLYAYPCVHAHTRTLTNPYIQVCSELLLLSCTCALLSVQYGVVKHEPIASQRVQFQMLFSGCVAVQKSPWTVEFEQMT